MRALAIAILVFSSFSSFARDILVASRFTNEILRYDESGTFESVFASGNGLANPNGIAYVPDGNLYAGLGDTGVVMRFDGRTGAFRGKFIEDAQFSGARAIAFGPDENLYVAAGSINKVLRYDGHTGAFLGVAAEGNGLSGPVGLAIAADGTLYVGGALSNAVYVFRDGAFVRRCAKPALHGTITGVLVAPDGAVLAATGQRNTILRVDPQTCAMSELASGGGLNLGIYLGLAPDGNLLAGSFLGDAVVKYDIHSGAALGTLIRSGAGGLDGTHAIALMPDENAETFTARSIVPGVGRLTGANGSFFRTSTWITNPHADAIRFRLRFNPGDRVTDVMTLEAGAMRTFGDVLADAFATTDNVAGVVIVEIAEGAAAPFVTARTFNDTAGGTFGQYIEAVSLAAPSASPAWIHGLAADDLSRTNAGIVNLGSTTLDATLSTWDSLGLKQSETPISVSPRSSVQVNGIGSGSEFSARIEAASGSFVAYASKLDNLTSDPIFVVPLPARALQWIDGVGAVAGAGGTFFRSSLSLANESDSAAVVRLDYTPRGATTATSTADVLLPPRQTRFYRDVMAELFRLDATAGTLALSSDVPVVAWVRTYNDRGAAGTLGQFIPSFGESDLIGSAGAVIAGISDDAKFRTNLGLVNRGIAPADVIVAAHDASGAQLGAKTYRVEAAQAVFIGRILRDLGLGDVTNAYLTIEPPPGAAVYAYASYVDNASTDQTFLRPLRR